MRTPSFPTLHTPLTFSNLRSSFRRNSSSASRSSYASDFSVASASSSYHGGASVVPSDSVVVPASRKINIMSRQPSMLDLEAERRSFASGLEILEPRPVVYWGSLEERMECL